MNIGEKNTIFVTSYMSRKVNIFTILNISFVGYKTP